MMYNQENDGWMVTNGGGLSDNSMIYKDPVTSAPIFPATAWSVKYKATVPYKRPALYCPELLLQVIPNPLEKINPAYVELNSTYGINECLGGSNYSGLGTAYSNLHTPNFSSEAYWFAETQIGNPWPWYGGGYPFFAENGLWDRTDRGPWPWCPRWIGVLRTHPGQTCTFLMGDGRVQSVKLLEYLNWTDPQRKRFAATPSSWAAPK
jgi:hypothetical protein